MKTTTSSTFRNLAVCLALLTAMSIPAGAHRLNDLDMHVVINDLGHARVVEVRDCEISSDGTEGYIKQYNLHGMTVGELSVSDETGTEYTNQTPWDVNRSRSEKTNCCGIAKGEDGPELCWGLGLSGERIYNIHYTLMGLVNSLDDYDGFIFKFYEPASGAYAPHARLVIELENGELTKENARVWAFRYYGTVLFENGKIVAETNQAFQSQEEGIVIMLQLNKGVIHPVTTRKGTFLEKLKKPAFKGSDYELLEEEQTTISSAFGNGREKEESDWKGAWDGLCYIAAIILGFILPFISISQFISLGGEVKKARQLNRLFGNKEGKVEMWSREVPCDGSLYQSGKVLLTVRPGDYDRANLITATIMRMVYQGKLGLIPLVDQNGNRTAEIEVKTPTPPPLNTEPDANLQHWLHHVMWNAAGPDHRLQPNELQEYMKAKPVEHRTVVSKISYNLPTATSLSKLDEKQTKQVYGLKKFLQEFTLSGERQVMEVGLWKEYLVFASLYGIAKQVYADMRKIWPDFKQLAAIDQLMMESAPLYRTLANNTLAGMAYVRSYETPQERAARLEREAEARRERSRGGGGSSSYGGGGGHSGGGGSGFR